MYFDNLIVTVLKENACPDLGSALETFNNLFLQHLSDNQGNVGTLHALYSTDEFKSQYANLKNVASTCPDTETLKNLILTKVTNKQAQGIARTLVPTSPEPRQPMVRGDERQRSIERNAGLGRAAQV